MIICLCKNISDRNIIKAVDDGCKSFREFKKMSKVGSDCKVCTKTVRKIFNKINKEKK
jgi:bacterioferritin-associated ferredoxin